MYWILEVHLRHLSDDGGGARTVDKAVDEKSLCDAQYVCTKWIYIYGNSEDVEIILRLLEGGNKSFRNKRI